MVANYSKEIITITDITNHCNTQLYVTDKFNVSYCLSQFILIKIKVFVCDDNYSELHRYFQDLLMKQKSFRAVVQKFNAICKALEL